MRRCRGPPLDDLFDDVTDLGRRKRLGQEVGGAALYRLHHGLERPVGGDEDDGQLGALSRAAAKIETTGRLSQTQVDKGQVMGLALQRSDGSGAASDGGDAAAHAFEADRQRGQDVLSSSTISARRAPGGLASVMAGLQ